MKTPLAWILAGGALVLTSYAADSVTSKTRVETSSTSTMRTMTVQETLDDVRATMGFVPRFFTQLPASALPSAWQEMKNFQMSATTALTPKTKELIGLAVAAQIPCRYCTYFHRKAASANGASESEIGEALQMAALTRKMSTLLNGTDIDETQFRKDVDRAITAPKKTSPTQASR
jgi:AhpD family alkylhydroperoxidase